MVRAGTATKFIIFFNFAVPRKGVGARARASSFCPAGVGAGFTGALKHYAHLHQNLISYFLNKFSLLQIYSPVKHGGYS
jgi:hypothetical protein